MIALGSLPREVQLLPDSRYQEDEDCPSSLLAETCQEQLERLHTLLLLQSYLCGGCQGRKRRLLAEEQQSLRDLYEAVWKELELAFSHDVVDSVRVLIETGVEVDCAVPMQYALF